MANKSNRINVRLTSEDKEILEAAAKKARVSLSEFIINASLREAEENHANSDKKLDSGSVAIVAKKLWISIMQRKTMF